MDKHHAFYRYTSVGHTPEFKNFLNWHVIYSWQTIIFVYIQLIFFPKLEMYSLDLTLPSHNQKKIFLNCYSAFRTSQLRNGKLDELLDIWALVSLYLGNLIINGRRNMAYYLDSINI